MEYRRIIPCAHVKEGRLVKGVNFADMKDVGDPVETAQAYNKAGADELVFLDIGATVEKKRILIDTVTRMIENVSIPLTVGGGIQSIKDIQDLLDAGVSRVAIGTAGVLKPEFVKQAATEFGIERIVAAIDTCNSFDTPSGFEVMVGGGTLSTRLDAIEWAKKTEDLGVGTILVTSVDADGTQAGYDVPVIRAITDAVDIPIFASGGAGTLDDLYQVITEGHADAVLVASVIHFGKYTIAQIKEYLASRGVPVRV